MPHQCVHCSRIIAPGSREILDGCSGCGGKFFFYIRDEQAKQMKEQKQMEKVFPIELKKEDKQEMEREVRDILGIENAMKPVILDLESVRVLKPGKFEIDLVSLMNRKPIIFKLEEGKYVIDLESSLPVKEKKKES